jgi:hypothetical protein
MLRRTRHAFDEDVGVFGRTDTMGGIDLADHQSEASNLLPRGWNPGALPVGLSEFLVAQQPDLAHSAAVADSQSRDLARIRHD